MTSTIKEHLIAARALIDAPEKWIKNETEAGSCYCTLGALLKVTDEFRQYEDAQLAIVDALAPDAGRFITAFNDHPYTTHADIMALFDRAIAAQDTP